VECIQDGEGAPVVKVVYLGQEDQASAPTCSFCRKKIFKVPGKFSGVCFEIVGGEKVHEECWETYWVAHSDICVECKVPITCINGRYNGRYHPVTDGKVHSECWEAYCQATVPSCAHCEQACAEVGHFSGMVFKFADGKECHAECYESYSESLAQKPKSELSSVLPDIGVSSEEPSRNIQLKNHGRASTEPNIKELLEQKNANEGGVLWADNINHSDLHFLSIKAQVEKQLASLQTARTEIAAQVQTALKMKKDAEAEFEAARQHGEAQIAALVQTQLEAEEHLEHQRQLFEAEILEGKSQVKEQLMEAQNLREAATQKLEEAERAKVEAESILTAAKLQAEAEYLAFKTEMEEELLEAKEQAKALVQSEMHAADEARKAARANLVSSETQTNEDMRTSRQAGIDAQAELEKGSQHAVASEIEAAKQKAQEDADAVLLEAGKVKEEAHSHLSEAQLQLIAAQRAQDSANNLILKAQIEARSLLSEAQSKAAAFYEEAQAKARSALRVAKEAKEEAVRSVTLAKDSANQQIERAKEEAQNLILKAQDEAKTIIDEAEAKAAALIQEAQAKASLEPEITEEGRCENVEVTNHCKECGEARLAWDSTNTCLEQVRQEQDKLHAEWEAAYDARKQAEDAAEAMETDVKRAKQKMDAEQQAIKHLRIKLQRELAQVESRSLVCSQCHQRVLTQNMPLDNHLTEDTVEEDEVFFGVHPVARKPYCTLLPRVRSAQQLPPSSRLTYILAGCHSLKFFSKNDSVNVLGLSLEREMFAASNFRYQEILCDSNGTRHIRGKEVSEDCSHAFLPSGDKAPFIALLNSVSVGEEHCFQSAAVQELDPTNRKESLTILLAKGPVSKIMDICNPDSCPKNVDEITASIVSRGLSLLACAYKEIDRAPNQEPIDALPDGMTFCGLIVYTTFQVCEGSAVKLQSFMRMATERCKYRRRRRAYMIDIDYDLECKQLLVANRDELYYIFTSYMDSALCLPVIKRKDVCLFAINFKIVPLYLTRIKCDQLISEMVTIINENPDEENKIDAVDVSFQFIHFLRFLILIARKMTVTKDAEGLTPASRLNMLFKQIDASGGKCKMGGSLSRNSFTKGSMIYLGAKKIPSKEKALLFDLHKWQMEKHFRTPSSQGTPAKGPSSRSLVVITNPCDHEKTPKRSASVGDSQKVICPSPDQNVCSPEPNSGEKQALTLNSPTKTSRWTPLEKSSGHQERALKSPTKTNSSFSPGKTPNVNQQPSQKSPVKASRINSTASMASRRSSGFSELSSTASNKTPAKQSGNFA